MLEIKGIEDQIIEKLAAEANKVLEDACRNNSTPPIRGEFIKGKIRWRGLRLVITDHGAKRWVEQRGKRISPIIEFNCNVW